MWANNFGSFKTLVLDFHYKYIREKYGNNALLLHLLLFIKGKYAFICVKRRPTVRRYIH